MLPRQHLQPGFGGAQYKMMMMMINHNKTSTATTYAAASATWIRWRTKKKNSTATTYTATRQHLQPGFGGALDGVPPHGHVKFLKSYPILHTN
jgi:hypothetical protein